MRTAFIQGLIEEARRRDNIFLIVGDLGFSVIEPFAQEFPGRFLNAGVAEQNMTGVAAGLASEGWHVFTYSIANFPTLRCLEQIRNDVCYHALPVTVVSVGAGVAYGSLGYSHHAVQDIAILRTLPGMKVLSPADPGETFACVRHLAENPGPSYLRLGKAGEKGIYESPPLGRSPHCVRRGSSKVAIVATGSILDVALDAAGSILDADAPSVFSMPWVCPLTPPDVGVLAGFEQLVCLQEHILEGGIGDILRAALPRSTRVVDLGMNESMVSTVGSQRSLRSIAGLTVEHTIAALRS